MDNLFRGNKEKKEQDFKEAYNDIKSQIDNLKSSCLYNFKDIFNKYDELIKKSANSLDINNISDLLDIIFEVDSKFHNELTLLSEGSEKCFNGYFFIDADKSNGFKDKKYDDKEELKKISKRVTDLGTVNQEECIKKISEYMHMLKSAIFNSINSKTRALVQENNRYRADYNQQVQNLAASNRSLSQQKDNEISELKEKHDLELQDLTEKLKEKQNIIAELNQQIQNQYFDNEDNKKKKETEIGNLRKQYEQKIAFLISSSEKKIEETINKLNEQHEKDIEENINKLNELNEQHEKELSEIRQKSRESSGQTQNELDELYKQVESLKRDKRNFGEQKEKEIEEIKKQFEEQKIKEIDEAKEYVKKKCEKEFAEIKLNEIAEIKKQLGQDKKEALEQLKKEYEKELYDVRNLNKKSSGQVQEELDKAYQDIIDLKRQNKEIITKKEEEIAEIKKQHKEQKEKEIEEIKKVLEEKQEKEENFDVIIKEKEASLEILKNKNLKDFLSYFKTSIENYCGLKISKKVSESREIELQNEINSKDELIANLKSDKSKLEEYLSERDTLIKNLQSEKSNLQSEKIKVQTSCDDQIANLRSDKRMLEGYLSERDSQIKNLQNEKSNLQSEKSKLQTSCDNYSKELTDKKLLESKKESLEKQIEIKNEQIASLESDKSKLEEYLSDKYSEINSLREDKVHLQSEKSELKTSYDLLSEKSRAKDNEIEILKSKSATTINNNKELETQIKLFDKEKEDRDNKISDLTVENRSFKEKIDFLNKEIYRLTEDKKKVNTQLDEYGTTYSDFFELQDSYNKLCQDKDLKESLENIFGKPDKDGKTSIVSMVINITKSKNIESLWGYISNKIERENLIETEQIRDLKKIFEISFKLFNMGDNIYSRMDTQKGEDFNINRMDKVRDTNKTTQRGFVKEVLFDGFKYSMNNRTVKKSLVILTEDKQ